MEVEGDMCPVLGKVPSSLENLVYSSTMRRYTLRSDQGVLQLQPHVERSVFLYFSGSQVGRRPEGKRREGEPVVLSEMLVDTC